MVLGLRPVDVIKLGGGGYQWAFNQFWIENLKILIWARDKWKGQINGRWKFTSYYDYNIYTDNFLLENLNVIVEELLLYMLNCEA